jgi:hypothetical protein
MPKIVATLLKENSLTMAVNAELAPPGKTYHGYPELFGQPYRIHVGADLDKIRGNLARAALTKISEAIRHLNQTLAIRG